MQNLHYKKQNVFSLADEAQLKRIHAFGEKYKNFLNYSKTERDCVKLSIALAERAGYKPFRFGDKLTVGDKRYYNNRGKSLYLFQLGKEDIERCGIRILAAHVDSPRIDLKQAPLYEKAQTAFFKTHYYGGIKKYQWTAVPLALHGVVTLADGTLKEICVGEEEADPVFYISDLLPHLSQKQNEKKLAVGIEGEELNLWVGGMPATNGENDKARDSVKEGVLRLLNQKYGMTERDFLSAELTAVPAYKAKDVGFDGAYIAAYGHDDKVCAFPALMAQLESANTHTTLTVLADKEEIGSEGVTGMQSMLFCDILEEICLALGKNIRAVRASSACLSADVTSAYDPTFADAFEKNNAAQCSAGVALMKFTGARGKSGASDASGEFVAKITNILDGAGVVWQVSELGKVDLGGGGTVAKYIASKNIDTLDVGTPVISMHAPYELISKGDLYHTYLAFKAFYQ
ncbi:MAG: aminopeptidase [Clostridia bacterium]|nr:aminopeptidase [Clostridia bacterium]